MAKIGETLAKNFDIPLRELPQQQLQAGGGVRGGGGGFESPEFQMDDLQLIEGVTKEYYGKIGNLKAFANQMQSMGIDVTRPDVSNPDSMEANNIYNKMVADIQNQGNALKGGEFINRQALADPDVAIDRDTTTGLTTFGSVQDTRATDRVISTNKLYAKSYNTKQEQAEANSQIQLTKDDMLEQLASLTADGADRNILLQKLNEIQSLGQATYDPTKNIDRAARKDKGEGTPPKQSSRQQVIFDTQAGDMTSIEGVQSDFHGGPVIQAEYVPATGKIFVDFDSKDGVITEEIDIKDRYSMNEFFNKHTNEKITRSQLDNLDPNLDVIDTPSEAAGDSQFYKQREPFESAITNLPAANKEEYKKGYKYKKFLEGAASKGDLIMPAGKYGDFDVADGAAIVDIDVKSAGFFKKHNKYEITFEYTTEGGSINEESVTLDPSNEEDAKTLAKILDRNENALPLGDLGIPIDGNRSNLL